MDWNPSIEQGTDYIQKNYANQYNPQQEEYGYHVQQPQSQQYSTLSPPAPYSSTVSLGLRLAAAVSYCFGWPTGFVFFLFSEKPNHFVRFHALQSLLFFGGLSLVGLVDLGAINVLIHLSGVYETSLLVVAWIVFSLLCLMVCAGWVMGIFNALRGRYYKLPFVGDFVEQYINRKAMPKK